MAVLPVTLGKPGNGFQQADVALDEMADVRTQHLDDNFLATLQACTVDLCDGGRCQRGLVEVIEQVAEDGTACREHVLSSLNVPEHSRLLCPFADDGLAAGFDDS